jgi:hypothetical protein
LRPIAEAGQVRNSPPDGNSRKWGGGIPLLLWTIGLVGALLTAAYASAFTPTRFNVLMAAGISFALGLVFLFILTVDHPLQGRVQR